MKSKALVFTFTLLFGTAAYAQTMPHQGITQNILMEGAFLEHIDDMPIGWAAGGFAGGDYNNEVRITEEPRDGNYVSLFIKDIEKGYFTLNLLEPIFLRPTWKNLLCSMDLRIFNFTQGPEGHHKPRMHFTFLDVAGKELSNTGFSFAGKLTDAWQTAERTVPIPADANSVKVWIGTFSAAGQIDFRNLYIAPRSE